MNKLQEREVARRAADITGSQRCECDPSVGINGCVWCSAVYHLEELVEQRDSLFSILVAEHDDNCHGHQDCDVCAALEPKGDNG